MAYKDLGFDNFLTRTTPPPQQLNPSEVDHFIPSLSADKLLEGTITSADGHTTFDVQKGIFKINNGIQDLVTIGLLPDGSVGALIKDSNGIVLVQTTVPL